MNARRISRWDDTPRTTDYAVYHVHEDGKAPRDICVGRNTRRVLEALRRSPIYSASVCRLSDQVLLLRDQHGVDIDCTLYRADPDTGRERFGVYTLLSRVERIKVGGAT